MLYPFNFSRRSDPKESLVTDDERELETFQLGQFLDLKDTLQYFQRLAIDVYTLEPILVTLFVLNQLWSGIQGALLLQLSSQILQMVEIGLVHGSPEIGAILKALTMRVLGVIFAALLQWASERVTPILKARVKNHFELLLMQAQLKMDLPTSQEPRSKVRASSHDAWTWFEGIVRFLTDVVNTLSLLVLIVQASPSTGSHLFTALCIMKPLLLTVTGRTLWNIPHIVHTDNEHWQRMKALNRMSAPVHRSEVLGSDIVNYIISGSYLETYLSWIYLNFFFQSTERQPGFSADSQIDGLNTNTWPGHRLHETSSMISLATCLFHLHSLPRETLAQGVAANINFVRQQSQELKNVYDSSNVVNTLVDGDIAYLNPDSEEKPKGMPFELRDVSFSYPGSQSIKPVLSNINLSIKPG
ncbi:hypothetical protein ARMGADRAFT_1093205 [Armillaria gallica]|uniref:Uncharacterized protein n=1 Tax=Armillaria gallica TaxID=47427 RepID=A0A2H3C8G7_ARMGA|nr:hypothetical protein ARMGADRAFT_1093205 [Armillaria gallica]